jgi:hypothetical protein
MSWIEFSFNNVDVRKKSGGKSQAREQLRIPKLGSLDE